MINEVLHRADQTRHRPALACLTKGQWPELARQDGFAAYSLPRTRLRSLGNTARVVGGLRRIIRELGIDLVHASENTALPYASLAARSTGTPYVWHIHSPLMARSREERLVAALLRRLPPARIVFTSPAAQAKTMALPGVPASVVYPGVDVVECRSGVAERARQALGVPDGVPVVSMFARVVAEKGPQVFVEALRLLASTHPELHGIICGPGDPRSAFWQGLERRRDEYGLAGRLHIAGDVRPPLKHDVVALSDVVLHPSLAESFGLAVLEAMAAGKPVVASEVDGPRILIRPGVDGLLVEPGDPQALAGAVAGLLDDPVRRADLGARASAAAERFGIDRTVAEIEAVWDEVLGVSA